MSKQRYPLSWPEGWRRTPAGNRKRAAFNRKERTYGSTPAVGPPASYLNKKSLSVSDSTKRVLSELAHIGISENESVISTNVALRLDGLPRSDQREPSDPGAAVYWQRRGQPMRCMAIDRYDRVADNLAAIAATLEAMRAIERHGGAEILDRAFTGFAALPERASQGWREQLGFTPDQKVTAADVQKAFKSLVHTAHPDKGGDPLEFQSLCVARENALRDLSQ